MNYALIVGGIILVICLVYYFITYNNLVRLNNKVKESFATMDVYLKKRWDLIPNIVETVKGYAKHEKDTLKDIVTVRNGDYDKLSQDEKIKTNEQINRGISRLLALAENYPDLKANENFLSLQAELSGIEDEIAQSRKYYNAVVREFNDKVEMIPSNIVAKTLGYNSKEMFIAEESEKKSVKVNFEL